VVQGIIVKAKIQTRLNLRELGCKNIHWWCKEKEKVSSSTGYVLYMYLWWVLTFQTRTGSDINSLGDSPLTAQFTCS